MRRGAAALVVLAFAAGCRSEGNAPVAPPTTISTPSVVDADGFSAPEGDTSVVEITYGDAPQQFGRLRLPDGPGPHPVVVFLHGGFWLNQFDLSLSTPQALAAVDAGYATWNVEYRRVGDPGGGYPGTLADVAAAVDLLAELAGPYVLDLDRVAVVGHSAGGHLALWIGQRSQLTEGIIGTGPLVEPSLVVGQAPVADLAGNLDLGGGAVEGFMGVSPADDSEAYSVADPAALFPVAVPQLIVQGADDRIVPADRAEMYIDLAGGGSVELLIFDGADHFSVIDPVHESWAAIVDRLP